MVLTPGRRKIISGFGKRLRRAREDAKGFNSKGYTQPQAAGLTKGIISYGTLQAWEGERVEPTLAGLKVLCDLYGVSIDYIAGWK